MAPARSRSRLSRYGCAVVAVTLALLLRIAITPAWGATDLRFILFFPAVTVAAWYGGLGPGLLALALSTAAVSYFFVEPYQAFNLPEAGAVGIFLIAGLVLSAAFEALRRSEARAHRTAGALRESERRLQERSAEQRAILDTAPVGIWICDPGCNRIVGNRVACAQLGLAPVVDGSFDVPIRELPEGVRMLLHGRELAAHEMPMHVAARTGRPVSGSEYEIVRADGQRMTMLVNASPVLDDARRVRSVVAVFVDITERKQHEQALKDADRHKDEFLAMLGHELRNPLAALSTAAHVLRAAAPGEPLAGGAKAVIDRQTVHMSRLIDDLLDLTRVRLGKLSLQREPLELAALVEEATEAKREAGALDSRAAVTLELAPAWVHGDKARLEQTYANLLDNALKFTPASGEIRVTVRAEGERAVLRVADNGRGIAPDVLPGVFELYVQGERRPERSGGGLGVGLALVRRLAELHDGSLYAESKGVGQGATFTVALPAIPAPPALPRASPRRRPAKTDERLRVLVIEDNGDARQMLRAALADDGHEVREAASGGAGLAAAADMRPDVVLLDIRLPDIDGYEVARRLRAAPGGPSLTLIAVSGYAMDDDRGRAREAGFDAHLVKPAHPDRLRRTIATLAARRRGSYWVSSSTLAPIGD